MANVIPSLSVNGFTTDSDSIMVKLYEYFLTSEYSQSNTFYGEIASLKYILQSNTGLEDVKVAIKQTLTKMYSRYFKTVNVIVNINESVNSTVYIVNITTVDQDGITSVLDNSVRSVGDKLLNIDQTLTELHGV